MPEPKTNGEWESLRADLWESLRAMTSVYTTYCPKSYTGGDWAKHPEWALLIRTIERIEQTLTVNKSAILTTVKCDLCGAEDPQEVCADCRRNLCLDCACKSAGSPLHGTIPLCNRDISKCYALLVLRALSPERST